MNIPATPSPVPPGVAHQEVSEEDGDLRFAAGLLRTMAGVAILGWATLYYMVPLAGTLLSLSVPAGGFGAVAGLIALTVVKLGAVAVLTWPGLHLLKEGD